MILKSAMTKNNKKLEVEQKLQKNDYQIHYMRQVANRKKAPPFLKESAQKSLKVLEEDRDQLLDELSKLL